MSEAAEETPGPEDLKIISLARARVESAEGAAVRDESPNAVVFCAAPDGRFLATLRP